MRKHLDESITRREILRLAAAGVAGASVSGWFGLLAEQAARKAPELLWAAVADRYRVIATAAITAGMAEAS